MRSFQDFQIMMTPIFREIESYSFRREAHVVILVLIITSLIALFAIFAFLTARFAADRKTHLELKFVPSLPFSLTIGKYCTALARPFSPMSIEGNQLSASTIANSMILCNCSKINLNREVSWWQRVYHQSPRSI